MSLGIAFKGPEGIVLAADSRVTLTTEVPQGDRIAVLPSTFDNATKLLEIPKQRYVGVVTHGLGGIGSKEPRTAHSFVPELDAQLPNRRLPVRDFADALSCFFVDQWRATMPERWQGPDMTFLVGGYDEDAIYGSVWQIDVPSHPEPREWNRGTEFGLTWGGQLEYVNRLIKGFDPALPSLARECLGLTDEQTHGLESYLEERLSSHIPYQFLPLQDCVDLAVYLIRSTIQLQTWTVGVRGVGGAIDVATITRTGGFQPVMRKAVGAGRRSD